MEFSGRRPAQLVAIALIATVVTQVIYISLRSNSVEFSPTAIWTSEAVAFLAVTVFAFVQMVRESRFAAAWAALAAGGILNLIQVGMGLAMFGPVREAGEALAPVFESILAGAFFLYFAGKFLFGFAGIVFGAALLRRDGGLARTIGGATALAGIAAIATNLCAMAVGMDPVYVAGAAGTVATLLVAVAAGLATTQD